MLTRFIIAFSLSVLASFPTTQARAEDGKDTVAHYVNTQWSVDIPYSSTLFYPLEKSDLPEEVILMLNATNKDFPIIAVTTQAATLPASILEDIEKIYRDSAFKIVSGPELISEDTAKIQYMESESPVSYISYTRYLKVSDQKHVILSSIFTTDTAQDPATLESINILKNSSLIVTKQKDRAHEAKRNIAMILFPGVMLVVCLGLVIWYQGRKRRT